MDNTPYDDVFRTLLTDCTELMIPEKKQSACFKTSILSKCPTAVNRNALPIPALKLSVKKPHRSFKYSESAIILNVRVQKTAV